MERENLIELFTNKVKLECENAINKIEESIFDTGRNEDCFIGRVLYKVGEKSKYIWVNKVFGLSDWIYKEKDENGNYLIKDDILKLLCNQKSEIVDYLISLYGYGDRLWQPDIHKNIVAYIEKLSLNN